MYLYCFAATVTPKLNDNDKEQSEKLSIKMLEKWLGLKFCLISRALNLLDSEVIFTI